MCKIMVSFLLGFLLCLANELGYAESIVNSKHNLSASGQGKVKGVSESEICIFCHAPHNASSHAPLWNRYDSGQRYIIYTSTTVKAAIGQPTGASKLCLSCHDGTVALGMVRSHPERISLTQPLAREGNLGADLSDDHPVSFYYDAALAALNAQLKTPALLARQNVRLDRDGQLQCTSCHDAHNNQFADFLRVDAIRGNLCLACHQMSGWEQSVHKLSPATWNHSATDPWPRTNWNNVADNACENCHAPHNAAGKKGLLNFADESDNCLVCHRGSVAKTNILAEFSKPSSHPIYRFRGLHDPAEDALVGSQRHVECMDCHNAHAAQDAPTKGVAGALQGVKGITTQGQEAREIDYEYELCWRCHSENNYTSRKYSDRYYAENSLRAKFDPANQSFHPVVTIGKDAFVPSLISPLSTSSQISCSDCHANDSGPANAGSGPKGPHGSRYSPILERNLSFADNQSESLNTYALCYKCHDRNNILANRSFAGHKLHIVTLKSPCTACHDPHGVKNSPHLINFDRNIVSANSSGTLSFKDSGLYHGWCSLKCHNSEHNNKSY